MAPVLVSPWTHFTTPKKESATPENKFKYEPGQATVQRRGHENYPYEDLLPHFPDIHWGPIADDVPYEDKGLRGDSKFRTLLSDVADVFDYTLKIGTEIRGLDLGKLNDVQRDDLARLVAVRGVVFFRGQKGFDVAAQRELGMYFGMLHKHASSAIPRKGGLEDVHVVYTGDSERTTSSPSRLWHSDVSYETQPPSYTIVKLLTGPLRGGGGDTTWCSQYAAYDLLSPPMQTYLKTLTALHSAETQASDARAAGHPPRRAPVTTEHPLVRTNPVTGWNSLFFSPAFVTRIVGVPDLESGAIIKYLTDVVVSTMDVHARFQWGEEDVAIWDNRVTTHATPWGFSHPRHTVRVACHGEKPVLDAGGRSQDAGE